MLVLADDLGWNGVGWHNVDARTPALDDLARTGVTLERLYASPACAPSRAALMIGRYAWRTAAARCNIYPASSPGIPGGAVRFCDAVRRHHGFVAPWWDGVENVT